MMALELLISWRYLFSKRKEKFISIISVISILGVAIGVMALIIVLAVMTGFDRDLKDKIVGNYSHISVSADSGIREYFALRNALLKVAHVQAASPNIQGQVFVTNGSRIFAMGLKGIDINTEPTVTKIKDYLLTGRLQDLTGDSVIIGRELSLLSGLSIGDSLNVISPLGKTYALKIVGLFNSGMYEYDTSLLFVNLKKAQEVFGLPDSAGEIAVKLDNIYLAEEVKKDLQNLLGYNYTVRTWIQKNPNFFAALKLEKLTMFIILTLIILVACFNIVSTLVVMVTEKIKDIGILKAVGMSSGSIKRIFTLEGLLIGLFGVILGLAAGLTSCLLLNKYQFIKLPADIYYIDHLPVSLEWWPDILVIILSAMAIAFISTLYPAHKAAGLNPVEALRYE